MFRTGAQLLFLTVFAGVFLLRESGRQPLAGIDERVNDFLAAHARRQEKQAPTTLVGIDEPSLKEHPLPWTPGDFALFFNSTNSFHSDLVATDEILSWNTDRMPPEALEAYSQYAQILRANVRKSGRVLLGASLGYPEDSDKLPPLDSIPGIRKVTGDVTAIPEFRVIEGQAEEELRIVGVQGFTNLPQGGSARSVPLVLRYCGQVVPSYVLQAAMLWEKVTLDEVEVELGSRIRLGNRVVIPIDAAGRLRVNFAVPIGRCSFEDLVVAAEQKDAKDRATVPADLFTSRAVVLSRTDEEATRVAIPLERPRPRGELFALALGTIQSRTFVTPAPWWSNVVAIGVLALAALGVPRLNRGTAFIFGSIVILAVVLTALVLMALKLIALSLVVPVGLTLFLMLARLMSPNVVKKAAAPEPAAPSAVVPEVSSDAPKA